MSQIAFPSTRTRRQDSDEDERDRHPQERHKGPELAAFWDNLSEIWLTKRALNEFNRRNELASPLTSQSPRREEPATRYSPKNGQSTRPHIERLDFRGVETSKGIKAFARHGGPDLTDLRNKFSDSVSRKMGPKKSGKGRRKATPSSTKCTSRTKTKTTGTYDRNFGQNLVDNSVFPARYKYPDGSAAPKPDGWDEIAERLAQSRPSLSPSQFSDGNFEDFATADAHASKEKQVSETVIPIIEGKVPDLSSRAGGVPFTNLRPLIDDNPKPGNPDVYYGARPEQLDRRIREELLREIVPSTQQDLPILPNFFLAVKGPDGAPAVAERQACYDGALGARGIYSLQSYGQDKPIKPDNKAYTITSIYQSGTLKMYTSHPTKPDSSKERSEYHLHQVNAWSLTGNLKSFREGATAYRNAKDWAKEQRDAIIAQANARAKAMQNPTGAESFDPAAHLSTTGEKALGSQIPDAFASRASLTSAVGTEVAATNTKAPKRRRSSSEGRAPKRRNTGTVSPDEDAS